MPADAVDPEDCVFALALGLGLMVALHATTAMTPAVTRIATAHVHGLLYNGRLGGEPENGEASLDEYG